MAKKKAAKKTAKKTAKKKVTKKKVGKKTAKKAAKKTTKKPPKERVKTPTEILEAVPVGDIKEVKQLEGAVQDVQRVKPMAIVTEAQYESAAAQVIALDKLMKKIKGYWEPLRSATRHAWQATIDKEKEMLAPVESLRKETAGLVNHYLDLKEQERREEQLRKDQEAEEKRLKEEAALEKKIAAAEAKGADDTVEALQEELAMVDQSPEIVETVAKTTQVAQGGSVTRREVLEVTVVDAKAFLAEVVKGTAPETVIKFLDSKLEQFVKLGALKEFPGLKIVRKQGASFRGG